MISLNESRRLIIKVGSALLADEEGNLRVKWIDELVADAAELFHNGTEIIIVSSGAIAVGRRILGLAAGPRNRALRLEESQAAAATGQVGVLRHDPMAMKPFCGYNFADYWTHWLSFSERSDNLPKIFHVNWFRKNENGFIWPGFGDNLRVLEWIIKRCKNEIDAQETPIGFLPKSEDINTSGLTITDEAMEELVLVDNQKWIDEMAGIREYFEEYEERLPEKLLEEHAKVIEALNAE